MCPTVSDLGARRTTLFGGALSFLDANAFDMLVDTIADDWALVKTYFLSALALTYFWEISKSSEVIAGYHYREKHCIVTHHSF